MFLHIQKICKCCWEMALKHIHWSSGEHRGFIGILHHNWAKIALRWKKDRHKHVRGALKAYPGWLLSTQKLESFKKKKKKQTNREDVTGVSPSASHVWSSINAQAPALKPSWSENAASYKNHLPDMSRDGATAGDQTPARHSRAHRARFIGLSSFKGENSCEDSKIDLYREGTNSGSYTWRPYKIYMCAMLNDLVKDNISTKRKFWRKFQVFLIHTIHQTSIRLGTADSFE